MPTITVNKAELYKELGKHYSAEAFDELCFEFGLELDEETEDSLKIEIPANRYDMLCLEGIAMNLNVFLERKQLPKLRLKPPLGNALHVMNVKPETSRIRPLVSCAVLRNIKFDKSRYDSFIDLQDKLHQNLARQRTLVSIGTHDLDTIRGPFSYEALPPHEIKFVPLNQGKEMDGEQIMEFYGKDRHMARYANIIRDSPVYPIIYDANRTVLSLPPLINGDHSKITLNTRNVFIEITALDKTKLEIVNNILVAMFSSHCDEPFTVEPVEIRSPHNNESRQTPSLQPHNMEVDIAYINSCCGLSLSDTEICGLLRRMGYDAEPARDSKSILEHPEHIISYFTGLGMSAPSVSPKSATVKIQVPPTRADVLQACDIMEDVAVAYGFNKLPRNPPKNAPEKIAAALPMNKIADLVREEAAKRWTEALPLILCSHDENFAWLNRVDDGKTAVRLQNPKTAEYQIVRTSLVPGLLKCVRDNQHHGVPIKIFEVSDVAFKDESRERKSRNERHFAAAWYGKTSGFEEVHGLLDRVMLILRNEFLTQDKSLSIIKGESAFLTKTEGKNDAKSGGYWYEEVDDPTFLEGHAASVYLNLKGQAHKIGVLGILKPNVLKNFDIPNPVSTVEINLEVFL